MPDHGRWNSGGDPSLNEINRTDQFLDALASQQPVYATDRGEAELAQLLAGWRDDVRETPMGHVMTAEDAAIALGRVTKPPRRRLSLAVIGSAAAAVLAIGGVGAVVAGSGPGDALYGLRTMLFGEQAQTRDDAVILAAQTEMQQVQQLIEQGDWAGAQAKLEAVTTTVATVADVERKQELVTQWQELTVKVEAQDPVATVPPGSPLPTFPDVPVAVLDPGTSSETTSTAPSSETTSPTSPSETTSPTSPSETTSPTSPSETTSPAPSSETTSAPTSSPSPTPSTAPTTTSVGAAPPSSSAPATTTPTSTTATRAPSATSTTVVQSATTTSAPLSTSSSVAAPPTPTPSPSPTPTPAPTVDEETVPSPTVPALPTTTTPIILLPVPGEAG
ncbi:hypothetical protein JN086_07245 [Mycolicibacterium austroafricanum]|uniref:Anti-sigma-D factor RsdA n=2 Tax=Mycolicibacterium TaxID=1866885 RepID=A0ABT8HKF2_MYCAO|nr:anti-sigma-D factor RsdA [Mycolicibacterium austroafricanum]MDN4521243.1 anti-sigma-D factor RsdA [Mycolicibacterium austroafricanum]QRZ08134.1 hypothetical protein JN090_06245 [Mycolicibacterium austroafricanum]QZT69798.1 hypothetical protein JN086_07245 [Mycolicibacterium austroafricanum]